MTYKLDTLFPVNFSATMLEDLSKCKLYFFRKHIQRLGRNSDRNPDLVAGGLFASACEVTRKAYFNDDLTMNEAIELGEELILTGENVEDTLKSNERVAYTFVKYWKRFPLDSTVFRPVQLTDGTYAIEYPFLFDLGIPHPDIVGQNICFTGKLDGIYNFFSGGRATKLVLTDEKTCKSVFRLPNSKMIDLEKEARMYKTSGQFLSYIWAVRQLINNGMLNTNLNLEELIVNRVPITKEYEPAFQLNIPMTEWQTDMFGITLINKIKDMLAAYQFYKTNNYLPFVSFEPALTSHSCNSYSRPCSYGIGCESIYGEENLESNFNQIVWDKEKRIEVNLTEYKRGLNLYDR